MANWGGGAKGAAGGAAAGAALGPWGAAAGGVIGGLAGLFGGGDDPNAGRINDYYNMVVNRQAPQIGADQQGVAQTSGFRQNQQDLINRLTAMANGQGPSLANAQLQQATDRNIAQQAGAAQSGRGNATLANIVAANNISGLGAQAAQQSALNRMAEQQAAIQQLGGVTNQARSADEQNAQFNAQQQNYMNEANLKAKLQAMGLNDSAIQSALGLGQRQSQMPTFGDQLLAGGTSLGSFLGSQLSQSRANRGLAGGAGNSGSYNGGYDAYSGA